MMVPGEWVCVYWYEDIYVPSLVVRGPETLHGMCSIHRVKWCVLNIDMVMLYLRIPSYNETSEHAPGNDSKG